MNKKYFIFFICSAIFIITISISVVIFSNSNKNNINEKIEQEMSYIETKLIGMINALNDVTFSNSVLLEQNTIKAQENTDSQSSNNSQGQDGLQDTQGNQDSQSQNGSSSGGSSEGSMQGSDYSKYNVENANILIQTAETVDWNYLKNTVETLYSSWPTIMIDLHSVNVKNEDILKFSNTLDTLIVNIQNEDKRATGNDLATLYSLIPVYIEQFSDVTDKINIAYTKSCIVNSYILLEDDNWTEIQTQINKASDYFGIIMNSVNDGRQQSNISKVYIAINEMNNVIKLQEKKLFYLKYINLMESAMQI